MALVEIGREEFTGRFKKFIIGEEELIKQHAQATDTSTKAYFKKLFFSRTDKKDIESVLIATAYEDTDCDSAVVLIHTLDTSKTSKMKYDAQEDAVIFRSSQGKNLKQRTLSCEAASFLINHVLIDTGVDGTYGIIFEHPEQKESIIQLFVSTDVTDAESFRDTVFAAIPNGLDQK